MKLSNLHCSNCGKKNEEKTLFTTFVAGWYIYSEFKIKYSTKPVLCPECFRPIREIVKKKLLENAAREAMRGKQLNFDSELDFAKSNPEPKQPEVSNAISSHYVGLGLGENPAIDCIHYIAAGTCTARGDAFDCEECSDYKSINCDEPDDDDLEFTNINRNKDEPDRRYENVCYYYSADGCCDLYGNISSCEDCNDFRIINEDELDDLKYTDI